MSPNFDAKKFYLGKLCKHGHDWNKTGQSLRRVIGTACHECRKAEKRKQRKTQPIEYVQINDTQYLGKLCPKGHDYQGTGRSLRTKSESKCLECRRLRSRNYGRSHRDKLKEYSRQYREANRNYFTYYDRHLRPNKEIRKTKAKEYYWRNKEKARLWWQKYYSENRESILTRCSAYLKTDAGKQTARRHRNKRKVLKLGNHNFHYTQAELKQVKEKFASQCAYCGKSSLEGRRENYDHFIPLSKGGCDAIGNLVYACSSCNGSKLNHDPFLWYASQPFFSKARWKNLLKVLGKTENTYNQLPLF